MNLIRDIAAIIGCISAFLALVATFSEKGQVAIRKIFTKHTQQIIDTDNKQNEEIKEIKDLLVNFINTTKEQNDKIDAKLESISEGSKDMLRQRIMSYYYKGKQYRELSIYQKEAVDELYKDYKKLGGNNYIDKYYARMSEWNVHYAEELMDD